MRTRIIMPAHTSTGRVVWAWGLAAPDGAGFEDISFTEPGGVTNLDLNVDEVTFFDLTGPVTFQVRDSAVRGPGGRPK